MMLKVITTFASVVLTGVLIFFTVAILDEPSNKSAIEQIRSASVSFTDTVRQKGYIDPRDYNQYMRVVGSMGVSITVEIEHKKKRFLPLYDDANNFATFNDEFEVLYESFYDPDILDVLYPSTATPATDADPSRRYRMNKGDLFNVFVTVQPSFGEKLRAMSFRSTATPSYRTFGGLILDES